MKNKLLIALAIAFALVLLTANLFADFTNGTPRTLEFIYATNDITPSTVVFVHTNSNPAAPLTNAAGQVLWPFFKAITNLNATAGGTNTFPVALSLPVTFFVGYGSNEWGRGDFFDVLRSAPPRSDVPWRIR